MTTDHYDEARSYAMFARVDWRAAERASYVFACALRVRSAEVYTVSCLASLLSAWDLGADRRTPGQVAYESFYRDGHCWENVSRRQEAWERAAAAVLEHARGQR